MSQATSEPEVTPAANADPEKILYCSFCFKSQHEVEKLICGPAAVFICDECVGICDEIVAGRSPKSGGAQG